jgi:hypothetical protein
LNNDVRIYHVDDDSLYLRIIFLQSFFDSTIRTSWKNKPTAAAATPDDASTATPKMEGHEQEDATYSNTIPLLVTGRREGARCKGETGDRRPHFDERDDL